MKSSFHRIHRLLLAGAAGVLLASTNASAGPDDNTLIYGQRLAITDIGPAYNAFLQYPSGYEAGFVIYDRLVTFDDQLRFNPQLAESWDHRRRPEVGDVQAPRRRHVSRRNADRRRGDQVQCRTDDEPGDQHDHTARSGIRLQARTSSTSSPCGCAPTSPTRSCSTPSHTAPARFSARPRSWRTGRRARPRIRSAPGPTRSSRSIPGSSWCWCPMRAIGPGSLRSTRSSSAMSPRPRPGSRRCRAVRST